MRAQHQKLKAQLAGKSDLYDIKMTAWNGASGPKKAELGKEIAKIRTQKASLEKEVEALWKKIKKG